MRLRLHWPTWNLAAFLLVALIGLGISSYLLVHYLSGTSIACGAGSGCDVVRLSPQAWVFGFIPMPLLGIVYYLGMIALAIIRTSWDKQDRFYVDELIALGAFVGVIESGFLFYVQAVVIGSFCTWCLGSGVATVGLFLLTFSPFPVLTKKP